MAARRALHDTEATRCAPDRDRASALASKIEAELGRTDAAGIDLLEKGLRSLSSDPPGARTLLDRSLATLERENDAKLSIDFVPRLVLTRDHRWLADSRHVATGDYGSYVIDAETGSFFGPVRWEGSDGVGVTADGRWAAYAEHQQLTFLDLARGRVAVKMPWASRGEARPVFSPAGEFLLATSPHGDALVRYDLAGGRVRWSVPLPWPNDEDRPLILLTITPDARYAAVTRAGKDTIVFVETAAGATVAALPRRHETKRRYPDQLVSADGTFVWTGPHGFDGFRPATHRKESYARPECGDAVDRSLSRHGDRLVVFGPHSACLWDLDKHAFVRRLVFTPPPADPVPPGKKPPKPVPLTLTQVNFDEEDYQVTANGYGALPHAVVGDARAGAVIERWNAYRRSGDLSQRPFPATATREIRTVKTGKDSYETWLGEVGGGRALRKLADDYATPVFSPDGTRVMVASSEDYKPTGATTFFRADDGARLPGGMRSSTRLSVTHLSAQGLVVTGGDVDELLAPDGTRTPLGSKEDYDNTQPVGFAGDRVVRASTTTGVILVTPEDGTQLLEDSSAQGQGAQIAISGDGAFAAMLSSASLRLWDVVGQKQLGELPDVQLGASYQPTALQFSADGKHVVVEGAEHTDVVDTARASACHVSRGGPVAVSNDRLVVGDAWVRLADCLPDPSGPALPKTYSQARTPVFSPDGKFLAWVANERLGVLEVATGRSSETKGPVVGGAALVFSTAGDRLVASGGDGTFSVFGAPDFTLRARGYIGPDHAVVFTPDARAELLGEPVAAASSIGCTIADVTYTFDLCRSASVTSGVLAEVLGR